MTTISFLVLFATIGQAFVLDQRTLHKVSTTFLHASWTPLQSWKHAGLTATKSSLASSSLSRTPCKIVVVGVGGAGCNAVTRMLQTTTSLNHHEIEFWAVNTDYQALGKAKAAGANVLTIGGTGLGAGGDPQTGKLAAEASKDEIRASIIRDADLVFITAGMGGGTGSGAAPVIASIADCLTVAVVTTPFGFEGVQRRRQATKALKDLQESADTVIPVSNDKLLNMIPPSTPLEQAFLVADDILRQGVVGIADVIVRPGLINVDFADVQSILKKSPDTNPMEKNALMGIGVGTGDGAASEAAEAAISSPLLEQNMDSATSIVFCISGGPSMTLNEVNAASKRIYKAVNPNANVIFGAVIDDTMGDDVSITVLATGVTKQVLEKKPPVRPFATPKPRPSVDIVSPISGPRKVPSFLKSRSAS